MRPTPISRATHVDTSAPTEKPRRELSQGTVKVVRSNQDGYASIDYNKVGERGPKVDDVLPGFSNDFTPKELRELRSAENQADMYQNVNNNGKPKALFKVAEVDVYQLAGAIVAPKATSSEPVYAQPNRTRQAAHTDEQDSDAIYEEIDQTLLAPKVPPKPKGGLEVATTTSDSNIDQKATIQVAKLTSKYDEALQELRGAYSKGEDLAAQSSHLVDSITEKSKSLVGKDNGAAAPFTENQLQHLNKNTNKDINALQKALMKLTTKRNANAELKVKSLANFNDLKSKALAQAKADTLSSVVKLQNAKPNQKLGPLEFNKDVANATQAALSERFESDDKLLATLH